MKLKLYIGPGPQHIRERLFRMAQENPPILKPAAKMLNPDFQQIHVRPFLSRKAYETADIEELEEIIRTRWNDFVGHEHDLVKIRAIMKEELARWRADASTPDSVEQYPQSLTPDP